MPIKIICSFSDNAYNDAFKKGHSSNKLKKRTNEHTNTVVEPKKRKEKSNQTQVLTQKQNTTNRKQETKDLNLIEYMLKEHEKVSDVTVEVIDDFRVERANEQTLDTNASPKPCTSSMPMIVGHVPRTRYVPVQAPSEDTFHGLIVPAVRENQSEEIRQILDLRQKINKDDLRYKLNSKRKFFPKEHINSETMLPYENQIQTNSSTLDLRAKLKSKSGACDGSISKTPSTSKTEPLAHAARGSNIHSYKTKDIFDSLYDRKDKLSAKYGDQRKVKVVNETSKLNSAASTTQTDGRLLTQYKEKKKIGRPIVGYDDLL